MSASAAPQSLGRRLSIAGAWTLAARMGLAGAGFLINVLLARRMAPEEFGLYFLAISVVSVLILLGQMGLQVSVVRHCGEALAGRSKDDPDEIALRFVLLGLAGVAVVAAIYIAGGHRLAAGVLDAPSLTRHAWIMALWAVVAVPLGIFAEAFRGMQHYRAAALFGGLSSALLLLLCVLPLFLAARPVSLDLLLNLCAAASACSLMMALFHVLAGRRRVRVEFSAGAAGILQMSLPLMLMSLATLVTTQADLWVAGAFLDKAEVAAYGVAARLVQLVLMPLLVLNAVIGPMVAQLHAGGEHRRLERLLGATAAAGCLPGALVLGVVLLAAEPILRGLYGDVYGTAARCLMLLSAGQLINACCGPAATVLMLCGRERAVMSISVATALLTLVGGMLLAPVLGMEGIALAAGLAAALHGLGCLLWVHGTLHIWTYPNITGLRLALDDWRARRRGSIG